MKHKLMNGSAIAKPNFDFCRVDIHVDQCWVEFQLQHIGRVAVAMQHILVGRTYCMRE